jgi:hypothetical protein
MPDIVYDIVLFTFGVCRADDANRFIKSNVRVILDWFSNLLSIYRYLIARTYFGSKFWGSSIDSDATLLKELISCSSGAKSHFTQVFIDPNERVLIHVKI